MAVNWKEAQEVQRANQNFLSKVCNLRGEQERVQTKTFTKWINSHLIKYEPPCTVDDLFEDFKDGLKLIQLLEVLSGTTLTKENRRNMQRVHYLSNARTALEYIESKNVKLVNINAMDIVDGKSSIILGLCWIIILHFQITEQEDLISRALAGTPFGKNFKGSSKQALLAWIQHSVSDKYGLDITDFGSSWRDGYIFNAMVHNIDPSLLKMDDLKRRSNLDNLENAFNLAENQLGIPRLLDAEDVDVERPDEKSIMTYVAQFLKKYPGEIITNQQKLLETEPNLQKQWDRVLLEEIDQLAKELDLNKPSANEAISDFKEEYNKYHNFLAIRSEKREGYEKLLQCKADKQLISLTAAEMNNLEKKWNEIDEKLKQWRWHLDTNLPGKLGVVGRWLVRAEKCLYQDWPQGDDEVIAGALNVRFLEHKDVFKEAGRMSTDMHQLKRHPNTNVKKEQLDEIDERLTRVLQQEPEVFRKLEHLELRYRIEMFCLLTERKLKCWKAKYGQVNAIEQQLQDYTNFVEKAELVKNFESSLKCYKRKSAEYKSIEFNGNPEECAEIDTFLSKSEQRWKKLTAELVTTKVSLDEIMSHWHKFHKEHMELERWLAEAEQILLTPLDKQNKFFKDAKDWQDKHLSLNLTARFIIENSVPDVAKEVNQSLLGINQRWEKLTETRRNRQKIEDHKLQKDNYLRDLNHFNDCLDKIETHLRVELDCSTDGLKAHDAQMEKDIAQMVQLESDFKTLSKTAQSLVQNIDENDVITEMLAVLKNARDRLVKVSKDVPDHMRSVKSVLRDTESIECGLQDLNTWIANGEHLLETDVGETGTRKQKAYFQDAAKQKAILENNNKLFNKLLSNASLPNINKVRLQDSLKDVSKRFQDLSKRADEQAQDYNRYAESVKTVQDWLSIKNKLLDNYSEPSSNQAVLLGRWERMNELQNGLQDGENKMTMTLENARCAAKFGGEANKTQIDRECEQLEKAWNLYRDKLKEEQQNISKSMEQYKKVNESQDKIGQWLREKERAINEMSPKSTVEEKEGQLRDLENELVNLKSTKDTIKELKDMVNMVKEMRESSRHFGESSDEGHVVSVADQLESRYRNLISNTEKAKQKCQQNLEEHKQYQRDFNEAENSIRQAQARLGNVKNAVSDRKELDLRQKNIAQVLESKEEVRQHLNAALKKGEQLLASTSVEGRDKIRQELNQLKAQYEELYGDVNVAQRQTDSLRNQCSTLDTIQSQLQTWMTQTEAHYRGSNLVPHSCNTLEEKVDQLQHYTRLLNDVENHAVQIQCAFVKEKEIGFDPQSTPLESEILKRRYEQIYQQAKEAVTRSETLVQEQEAFEKECANFAEWLSKQAKRLAICNILSGASGDLQTRLDKLKEFQTVQVDGNAHMDNLLQLKQRTCLGTASVGQDRLQHQVDDLKATWEDLLNSFVKCKEGLQNALNSWQNFENAQKKCEIHATQLQHQLRDIQWQASLSEKKVVVKQLKSMMQVYRESAADFDELKKHAQLVVENGNDSKLLNASNQLKNKHILFGNHIEEKLNQWKTYVQEHENFNKCICDTREWIDSYESRMKKWTSPEGWKNLMELQSNIEQLNMLMAQREEGLHHFVELNISLEKLMPHTSNEGGEKARFDVINLKQYFDSITAWINKSYGRMDDVLAQWTLFNKEVEDLEGWLHQQRSTFESELCHVPRTNLSEIKSRLEVLHQLKALIDARQAIVHLLGSKTSSFQDKRVAAKDTQSSLAKVTRVVDQFNKLQDDTRKMELVYENAIKAYDNYKEAINEANNLVIAARSQVNTHLDFCTMDPTALNAQLEHLKDVHGQKRLVEEKIEHAAKCGQSCEDNTSRSTAASSIADEINETRDTYKKVLADARTVEEKIKERHAQWNSWEQNLAQLDHWLADREAEVKVNCGQCSTLEQKIEQLNRYKVLNQTISTKQADFNKVIQVSSSLASDNLKLNTQVKQLCTSYKALTELSKELCKKSVTYVDEHNEYERNHNAAKQWLTKAQQQLTNCGSMPKDKYNAHLQLDVLANLSLTQGQGCVLVEGAATWADKTNVNSNAEGRERIRKEMLSLHDTWNNFCTTMVKMQSDLEASLLNWNEMNKGFEQIDEWLQKVERGEKNVDSTLKVQPEKAILQDVDKYKSLLSRLTERAEEMISKGDHGDDELCKKAKLMQRRVDQIALALQERVKQCEERVHHNRSYQEACSEFKMLLQDVRPLLASCAEACGDLAEVESMVARSKQVADKLEQAKRQLEVVKKLNEISLRHCNITGQMQLHAELHEMTRDYNNLESDFEERKKVLQLGLDLLQDFHSSLDELEHWLKQEDSAVTNRKYDVLLKSNLSEKKNQYELFVNKYKEMQAAQKEVDLVASKAQKVLQFNSQSQVANFATKVTADYQNMLTNFVVSLKRAASIYNDHIAFQKACEEFRAWYSKIHDSVRQVDKAPSTEGELQRHISCLDELQSQIEKGTSLFKVASDLSDCVLLGCNQSGSQMIQEELVHMESDLKSLTLTTIELSRTANETFDSLQEFVKSQKATSTRLSNFEDRLNNDACHPSTELLDCKLAVEQLKLLYHDIEVEQAQIVKLAELARQLNHTAFRNSSAEQQRRFDQIQRNTKDQLVKLERLAQCEDELVALQRTAQNWLTDARTQLSRVSEKTGSLIQVEERLQKASRLVAKLQREAESLMSGIREAGDLILNGAVTNRDEVKRSVQTTLSNFNVFDKEASDVVSLLKDMVNNWRIYLDFDQRFSEWLQEMEKKVRCGSLTPQNGHLQWCDYEEEVLRRNADLVQLNNLASELEKLTTSSQEIGCNMAQINQRYLDLKDACRELTLKAMQSAEDFNAFQMTHAKAEQWIEHITHKALYSSSFKGDKRSLLHCNESIHELQSDLDEGQKKMTDALEQGDCCLKTAGRENVDQVRRQMDQLRTNWSELTRQLQCYQNNVDDSRSRWSNFEDSCNRLGPILNRIEKEMNSLCGIVSLRSLDFAEKKMQLEKIKVFQKELDQQNVELEQLHELSNELQVDNDDRMVIDEQLLAFTERHNRLQERCKERVETLSRGQLDLQRYNGAIEEIERWILQTSFKLMSKNLALSSNTEITAAHEGEHNAVLQDIDEHRSLVDNVLRQGRRIAAAVSEADLSLANDLKSQVTALKVSYNNLCQTAAQTKERLIENMNRWTDFRNLLKNADNFINSELVRWWSEKELLHSENLNDCERQIQESHDMKQRMEQIRQELASTAQVVINRNGLTVNTNSASNSNNVRSYSPQYSSPPLTVQAMNKSMENTSALESLSNKTIDNLGEQINRVEGHLEKLNHQLNLWNTITELSHDFRTWLAGKKLEVNVFSSRPPKSNLKMADAEIAKLEQIFSEVQLKESDLRNLQNYFAPLAMTHKDGKMSEIHRLGNEYNELRQQLISQLEQREKIVNDINEYQRKKEEVNEEVELIFKKFVPLQMSAVGHEQLQKLKESRRSMETQTPCSHGTQTPVSQGRAAVDKSAQNVDAIKRVLEQTGHVRPTEYENSNNDVINDSFNLRSFVPNNQSNDMMLRESATSPFNRQALDLTSMRNLLDSVTDMRDELAELQSCKTLHHNSTESIRRSVPFSSMGLSEDNRRSISPIMDYISSSVASYLRPIDTQERSFYPKGLNINDGFIASRDFDESSMWRSSSPDQELYFRNYRASSPIRRSYSPTRQPYTPTQRPLTLTQRPSTPSQRPSTPTERPSTPTERPSTQTERPSTLTQRPSTPTQRPSTPTQRPSILTQRPSTPIQRPSKPTQRPSTPTQKLVITSINSSSSAPLTTSRRTLLKEKPKELLLGKNANVNGKNPVIFASNINQAPLPTAMVAPVPSNQSNQRNDEVQHDEKGQNLNKKSSGEKLKKRRISGLNKSKQNISKN